MRRLNALVLALPPDAAVWREQAYPPTTELIAVLIERQEEWSRAIFQALRNQRRVSVPQPMRILRPGERAKTARRVETDPRKIAAFFRQHFT